MATLDRTKLRGSVVRRSPETAPDGTLRLRLDLDAPLTAAARAALGEEVALLAAHPIEGLVAPRAVEAGPQHVVLTLDAIHAGAIRLADLLKGLTASGDMLETGLAAALTATAAQLTHKIHLAPGLHGRPRLHGAPHAGALVLTPLGTVALMGTGLPHIDALLIPPDPAAEARHTAPEVAAGGSVDPRSDVYGLGVLYLCLLSGQTPWPDVTPEAHLAAIASGRLSNPGVAIPDPRPALVEVLRRAMAPAAGNRYATALGFGQAISNELKASGRPRGDAHALMRLLERAVPRGAPRGPAILAPSGASIPPVMVPKDTPTSPAPPSHDAWVEASRPPDPGLRGWSHVLGEGEVPPAPAAPEAPPAPATPPPITAPSGGGKAALGRISLPIPPPTEEASKSSSLPLPSGGHAAPSGPTAPTAPALPPASPIDALYDDDVPSIGGAPSPRRTPRVAVDTHEGSMKGTLLVGAGLIAAVCVVWLLVRGGGSEPAVDASAPPPTAQAALPDAGPARAPSPVIPDAAPRRAGFTPDAGAVLKPLGFLTVFSSPTGATVELDGGYVGKTPLVLKHDFQDKVYELTVLADGYKKWSKAVRPDRDKKSINVKAVLEKK